MTHCTKDLAYVKVFDYHAIAEYKWDWWWEWEKEKTWPQPDRPDWIGFAISAFTAVAIDLPDKLQQLPRNVRIQWRSTHRRVTAWKP